MKQQILGMTRALGLLAPADTLMLMRGRLRARRRNRDFLLSHPDFAVPPEHLAFDAYHHVDWTAYREIGRRHAEVFAGIIEANFPPQELAILEWGCGPARIIRHMRDCLPSHPLRLAGTDYNAGSIAWCRTHIPGIDFAVNGFSPPLPFPDNSFDATYNFSVFTHLSEASQKLWAAELLRVLKPGGLLVCSTHGDFYRRRLASNEETARYESGNVVVQDGYEEGKKWYLALHPPAYVRNHMLAGFTDIARIQAPPSAALDQDLWSARKPA